MSWINPQFVVSPQSANPEQAGVRTAILGSLWTIAITILFAFPLGVGAAIYLEEYATDNRLNRIIQTNINNLAGVPSIIYGMLGLAIFVRLLEPLTSGQVFGLVDPTTANGRTILSAGLTLGLLILPLIIINAQEAIRAVPELAATGQLWPGRHQVADDLAPRAAQCHARHPDRHDPGRLAGHRRDGAAGRGRRLDLHHRGSQRAVLQIHHAAHPDLPVDRAAPGRVSQHRGGSHPCAAGSAADAECHGRPAAQSLQPEESIDDRYPANPHSANGKYAIEARDLSVYYGDFRAVKDVNLQIERQKITAIIGPSGCGKSTMLRAFNRMNELVPTAWAEGEVLFHGQNIYDPEVDPVQVRRRIGMVFQKPNPFPKSIYENVAWGARINGYKGNMDELVEQSLRQAALWDEVKDKLDQSGFSLSGGQQQRLCIARTIAVRPEIILMDEPASALDPIATLKIEDLMRELAEDYTIIVVTHNMQQAARVSDYTAFFMMDEDRAGYLVEYGPTNELFTNPKDQRTEDYITGRFG